MEYKEPYRNVSYFGSADKVTQIPRT